MWPRIEFIKPLPPPARRMPGIPKLKRVKHVSESQDAKYPSQRLMVPRTMRRDGAPPVSESGDQDGGPAITPMKMTKMMARIGGKTKVSRSRNKTPMKTPNSKQPMCQQKEDMSLTCDEAFDDLFTHTPNGMQLMNQDGSPAITPMKMTKMMTRIGGKTKVYGSRNKTPKKTPSSKQPMSR
uniref:Uncharacterized protein n=1 Tax=Lactuca sativa TaxID=4236 RepID=A0A9R1WWH1_LACSA|nr:hypothetical protein LSAT_V11C800449330 [Lactuca sativa]